MIFFLFQANSDVTIRVVAHDSLCEQRDHVCEHGGVSLVGGHREEEADGAHGDEHLHLKEVMRARGFPSKMMEKMPFSPLR